MSAPDFVREDEGLERLVAQLTVEQAHEAARVAVLESGGSTIELARAEDDLAAGRLRHTAGLPKIVSFAARCRASKDRRSATRFAFDALTTATAFIAQRQPYANLTWPHPRSAEAKLRGAIAAAIGGRS